MYTAIISKIVLRQHPNADRLLLGDCNGFQVIVGLNTEPEQLGIYFPCDGALSDDYCKANRLYPEYDSEGNRTGGGFIDPSNNRVRAQNFRGEISEGLWMPLSSLSYLGDTSTLAQGQLLTEFNGVTLCQKWINPATLKHMAGVNKAQLKTKMKRETHWLPMHTDTSQLKHELRNLRSDWPAVITEKMHGTSGRSGWDWCSERVPFFKWLAPLMKYEALHPFISYEEFGYKFLTGTRRTLLTAGKKDGYYTKCSFRQYHSLKLQEVLPQGFQLYYEIVGWSAADSTIMPICDNRKVSKEFAKQYGPTTTFSYGCEPGTSEVYAYALYYTGPDGVRTSYTYPEMARLCSRWGIKVVPLLYSGTVQALTDGDGNVSHLVEVLSSGRSEVDSTHIREGVCIETVRADGTIIRLKNKSRVFYILEDVIKSTDAVDIEEAESYG